MLDERRSAVLRTIVEEYTTSAHPVGSATVNARSGLGVSPATIRNDMGYLEDAGYITQPHTSAGRVPSELGYRYFVDHFARNVVLPRADRNRIARFFAQAGTELEVLLTETSRFLAGLTRLASIVVAPQIEDTTLLSIHLTRLDPHRLLAVLVCKTGRVSKVLVDSPSEVPADRIEAAGSVLTDTLVGTTDWLARRDPDRLPSHADPEVQEIVSLVIGALGDMGDSVTDLYLDGTAGLADRIEQIDDVRGMLRFIEERNTLLQLVEHSLDASAGGVTVWIGSEVPSLGDHGASMVVGPWVTRGAHGFVGVLGPTRMNYPLAISAIDCIAGGLERSFAQQEPEDASAGGSPGHQPGGGQDDRVLS